MVIFILQVVLGFFLPHLDLYGIMYVLVDDMTRDLGAEMPEPFISAQGSAPFSFSRMIA